MNKKQIVKLTESDLHRIVKESLKKVITEIGDTAKGQFMLGKLNYLKGDDEIENYAKNRRQSMKDNRQQGRMNLAYNLGYDDRDKLDMESYEMDEYEFRELCRSVYTFNDYIKKVETETRYKIRKREYDKYESMYIDFLNDFASNHDVMEFYDEYDTGEIDERKLYDELDEYLESNICPQDF